MSSPIRYRIKTPEVVYETIEGETVIVNLESGLYYSLSNQTSTDVWSLVEAGLDFPAMCVMIGSHYSQDELAIRQALRDFLILLQQEGLVEVDQRPVTNPAMETNLPPASPDLPFELPKIERFSDMQDLLLLDPIHDVDEAGWPNLPDSPQS